MLDFIYPVQNMDALTRRTHNQAVKAYGVTSIQWTMAWPLRHFVLWPQDARSFLKPLR
jgi:hypothetical protein